MVRPERRVVLAGASPVRVSAGAPGSRFQPEGEIQPSQAECQKPLKQRGANQRAATSSERNSLVILSAERCFERAEPLISRRRQQTAFRIRSECWTSPGSQAVARWERAMRNRRDPTWQPVSGKDRAYKAGRLKLGGARRESERSVVPEKACKITRWREGALL